MMARSDEEVLRLMNVIDSQRLKSRTVVGHSVTIHALGISCVSSCAAI
jgi:hypothetical protein